MLPLPPFIHNVPVHPANPCRGWRKRGHAAVIGDYAKQPQTTGVRISADPLYRNFGISGDRASRSSREQDAISLGRMRRLERQVPLDLVEPKKIFTKCFARDVLELAPLMRFNDVARHPEAHEVRCNAAQAPAGNPDLV